MKGRRERGGETTEGRKHERDARAVGEGGAREGEWEG